MIGCSCEQTVSRWSATGDTAHMELAADLTARCAPADLFAWIDDLERYPQWMGLVHRAERLPPDAAAGDEQRPRWDVELRARVGPFARSKRLIMARTRCDTDAAVVFERAEVDGRKHSMWRLSATITPSAETGGSTQLRMLLHYGGSLWTGGIVERVLHDEINRSRDRLLSLVDATTP